MRAVQFAFLPPPISPPNAPSPFSNTSTSLEERRNNPSPFSLSPFRLETFLISCSPSSAFKAAVHSSSSGSAFALLRTAEERGEVGLGA